MQYVCIPKLQMIFGRFEKCQNNLFLVLTTLRIYVILFTYIKRGRYYNENIPI